MADQNTATATDGQQLELQAASNPVDLGSDENKQGEEHVNVAFVDGEPEELPPMTYIDFVPQCLGGSVLEGKEPGFAEFGTCVEQANQWLRSMPQFSVYRCETVNIKLGHDMKVDNDITMAYLSSNGKNVWLRVLRVWLVPKPDPTQPVQQIAYITVLPDHKDGPGGTLGNLTSLAGAVIGQTFHDTTSPVFDNLTTTVEKLNIHLLKKPLSGHILSVETLPVKCQEANIDDTPQTESTLWTETGSNTRLFLNALRVFYIIGQPAMETVGFQDVEPEMSQQTEGFGAGGKLKFGSFDHVVMKAAAWLKKQEGIRVVNIQSVNIKLEKRYGTGPWLLDTSVAGFTESHSLSESRYTKILRLAYVKEQKGAAPSPYSGVTLTSKLFVPIRLEGRRFEGFSKTMMRVIKWLNATRAPLLTSETVLYRVSIDDYGPPVRENRVDNLVISYQGQQYVTCIRLYFSSEFQEPPPEIAEEETVGWGWGCSVQ